ncbi:hypothetical protein BLNAU_1625 [Blattamonas nauphoetae]|uniref:Rho-GAP domain-containing protein n=1 Tax=Blattamonas nauphoetae TaxID=2049346 RepID=A0ABQ9YIM5_9EUKA|nr:hypothetical protein BLNAU_1625 [Blattamonas nauphoetae]
MTTKHRGFYCLFVFDEPEVIRNKNSSWHDRYRVFESSPTLPIYASNDLTKPPSFPTRREDFGLVEVLPDETLSNYKQRVIEIVRTQPLCRRMWRRFNDTPIPSVFKQSDLFGTSTPIDIPALCPTSPNPRQNPSSSGTKNEDSLASSSMMGINAPISHRNAVYSHYPFDPLRIFHLLPKPDEPPLSEFASTFSDASKSSNTGKSSDINKLLDTSMSSDFSNSSVSQASPSDKSAIGHPMELFCRIPSLKLDAHSFHTYSVSICQTPSILQRPFSKHLNPTYSPSESQNQYPRYYQPINTPAYPFHTPYAKHSALPIPYSSPLTPATDYHGTPTSYFLNLPKDQQLIQSFIDLDSLNSDHLCSAILDEIPSGNLPVLLFLVPAQLHLYPIHTPDTTNEDQTILSAMTQQTPRLSTSLASPVPKDNLFSSVAGVLTQGRRIVSQSVFSATEDWHYMLDKLNSIIRPSIERVQVGWDDAHQPIVTLDRMNGSGVDVRAFVIDHTFCELARLMRRPTIADLLIRSSPHLVEHIKIHPRIETLTLNADVKAQLIPRLLPPSDQKLKYLRLLRVAAHLNQIAPANARNFARLSAASLLPQYSSHFDIPLHSQDKLRFEEFIQHFLDFFVHIILTEAKKLAELGEANQINALIARLSVPDQSVYERALLTVAPAIDAIADYAHTTILTKPKTVSEIVPMVELLPSQLSVWDESGLNVEQIEIDQDTLAAVNTEAEIWRKEKEKQRQEEAKSIEQIHEIRGPERETFEERPMPPPSPIDVLSPINSPKLRKGKKSPMKPPESVADLRALDSDPNHSIGSIIEPRQETIECADAISKIIHDPNNLMTEDEISDDPYRQLRTDTSPEEPFNQSGI